MQLTPHKRMHIDVSYFNLFIPLSHEYAVNEWLSLASSIVLHLKVCCSRNLQFLSLSMLFNY